jgi:two-component system CheB/CheR fusion protein
VREAVDAQRIEANSVYVIPPDSELTVVGGALHLAKPAEPRGRRLPIDAMFGSLAREFGERAIGVVQMALLGMESNCAESGCCARVSPPCVLIARSPWVPSDPMPDTIGLTVRK